MKKADTVTIIDEEIRKGWDNKSKTWQFSIVDVIATIIESKDPRNYWKVLKSRLNKTNKELVTRCNQLKLPSSDGKSYLTDTADAETMLEIINMISTPAVSPFRIWFDKIESLPTPHSKSLEESDSDMGADLLIDAYETDKDIVIVSLVAGVSIEDTLISITCDNITIKGKRISSHNTEVSGPVIEELYWGIFSRTISLPSEVDIDEASATALHGLLTIKLPKKDKLRSRILKVKSLE